MYLWRRTSEIHWVKAHEDLIQAHAHGQLVIVRKPGRKRLQLEVACSSRSRLRALLKKFGGRVEEIAAQLAGAICALSQIEADQDWQTAGRRQIGTRNSDL